jgi:hypothetical protein
MGISTGVTAEFVSTAGSRKAEFVSTAGSRKADFVVQVCVVIPGDRGGGGGFGGGERALLLLLVLVWRWLHGGERWGVTCMWRAARP